MDLSNKVALVTGSNRGIGFAIACGLALKGAKVVISSTTLDSALESEKELCKIYPNAKTLAVMLDVTNQNSVELAFKKVFDEFGIIDILVNNAGITINKNLETMTDREYENVLNVNVGGVIRCSREVLKYMKNGGSIINISSINSIYGSVNQSVYSASKAAINGITKSLAKELGPKNIRVNAILPGMILTDMVREHVTDEIKERLIAMSPLKRIGTPEDLQGICVLLASDEGSFITGSLINVDGGLVL